MVLSATLLSSLNVSGTLNRLNFLYRPPPVCSPARASRRAHRNGNTVVLAWGEEEEKKKGGPGDVTKSLWRNILLIHVRLYNLAHFYSERPRARRSVEHASAVAERAARRHRVLRYRTIFRPRSPLCPNSTWIILSSRYKKKKNRNKKSNLPPFLASFSLTLSFLFFFHLFFASFWFPFFFLFFPC